MTNKNILLSSFAASILLFSCTEKTTLSTTGSGEILKDTSYIAAVESKDPRKVLAEYATGVKCPNCPDGSKILKEIGHDYPNRFIVAGLHALELSDPIKGESKYDLRSEFARDLFATYLGNPVSKPAAAFDRLEESENSYFSTARIKWPTIVEERMTVTTPLNLRVNSVFNADSNVFIVTVTGAYTSSVSKKQFLTIMITEDSIVDVQDGAGGVIIHDYLHMHVLRDKLTQTTGDPILSDLASIEPGRVFVKILKYNIPEGKEWNVDHLNVIAFVHNNAGADKEVQQAEEIKLKP